MFTIRENKGGLYIIEGPQSEGEMTVNGPICTLNSVHSSLLGVLKLFSLALITQIKNGYGCLTFCISVYRLRQTVYLQVQPEGAHAGPLG